MPQAGLIAVADSVVSALNAAQLSDVFVAVRSYVDPKELKNAGGDGLTVFVYAGPETSTLETRNSSQVDYRLQIAVIKKVTDTRNDTIDPLVYVAQEIADYFRFRTLLERDEKWIETDWALPYLPSELTQNSRFTSFMTQTFRGARS